MLKEKKQLSLAIITILGFAFFLGFIFRSALFKANTPLPYEQEQIVFPLPARLKIPKIKVDAVVESVGLAEDGSVAVPKGPNEVAWFELSPRPGEKGSSIIDGHSGWKNGIPAVFDDLHKLRKGDEIQVEDSKGTITTFVVREIRTYGPNEYAPDVFNSSGEKAHLNLITCTGIWSKIDKTHSDRLVVFADKE